MASKVSAEHIELAEIVRSVHRDLRKRYKENSGDQKGCKSESQLWLEHCQKEDVLGRYAEAMHRLARVHWMTNNASTRIDWCYSIMKNYFHCGGILQELQRYRRREVRQLGSSRVEVDKYRTSREIDGSAKIRVLDVGSCYNPFGVYDDLDVLGLDLHPATKDVSKCDFLNLDVAAMGDTDAIATKDRVIRRLPGKYFKAVVFSLLLEYLPLPAQRLRCFVNASALLSEHGLLLIVTPDSKHRSRNSAMIKSWRLGLESLGFHRMCYEKQTHLHCMAFVKVADAPPLVEGRLAERFYIPQDFQEFGEEVGAELAVSRTADEDSILAETFSELPEMSDYE